MEGGVLTLEIKDNGHGIAPGDLSKARSFGIRGLRERAATVGGWVDLSSGLQGTALILSVPLRGVIGDFEYDDDGDPIPAGAGHDPSSWGAL